MLDSCARLHLDRRGRLGSYLGCGLVGVVLGAAVVVALGVARALPAGLVAVAVAAPLVSFALAVKLGRILVGYERIVLYECLAAMLGGSALALWLAGQPVVQGLDLVMVGVATALVAGRIGCLRVGCCHGRPCRWGIAYPPGHGRAGFPVHYVRVRLFPIPLVESAVAAGLAVLGAATLVAPHVPGEVLATTAALYGLARFLLELARGDEDRPSWLGLSEAQWIAVISAWLVVLAARAWSLDRGPLYLGIAAALAAAAVAVALARRIPALALREPRRVRELHDALVALGSGRAASSSPVPTVAETPYGLRLSRSEPADQRGDRVVHLALSLASEPLGARAARCVAGQVGCLLHLGAAPELSRGLAPGVFHLRWTTSPD